MLAHLQLISTYSTHQPTTDNRQQLISSSSSSSSKFHHSLVTSDNKRTVPATMSSLGFTRKLRGRMRSNTCRIILLTSLVWVIVDFVLIAHYSDCIGKDGWRCKRSGEYDVEVSTHIYFSYFFNLYRSN